MRQYDHKRVEKKWQKSWQKSNLYKTKESKKKKFYCLDMFPYPSGEGLHVGHPKGYIATDIISRYKRMTGHDVLHPMGWDAFGLPAENYAIKNKIHPEMAVKNNVKRFKNQVSILGFDYDWSREINTTDPEYYKWTQWTFLQMYKKGLAYESNEPINWCPSCKTGLANEDLEDGKCERCNSEIEQRPIRQWVLSITKYADRLLKDLSGLDWPEHIKELQRNWIGRSEGSFINFQVGEKLHFILLHGYKGSPQKNFFPWLKLELEKQGHTVEVPKLPKADNPDVLKQAEFVLDNCRLNKDTVILGHSHGGSVAMKVVESLKTPIKRLVLAASFLEPKRKYQTDFNWQYNFEKIKKNSQRVTVLKSLKDSVVPPSESDKISEVTSGDLVIINPEENHICGKVEPKIFNELSTEIKIFTTRPDTIFGATYLVLSPEHSMLKSLWDRIKNKKEVQVYIDQARKKTELQRTTEAKEKTGVELKGIFAVNPATKKQIPVWIADYVLIGYGTGAIMAVPAHDERDFEFANKFKLPVKKVIEPKFTALSGDDAVRKGLDFIKREAVCAVVRDPKTDKYLCISWKGINMNGLVTGGLDDGEDLVDAGRREVFEETGYKNLKLINDPDIAIHSLFYHRVKKVNRWARFRYVFFELEDYSREDVDDVEASLHEVVWKSKEEMSNFFSVVEGRFLLKILENSENIYLNDGVLINSGEFTNLDSETARKIIVEKIKGEFTVTYRLKDWVFSRQRYWGEPIPLVHCEKCGVVPVPENDLPVKLPKVKDYEPTGTGESPLANISSWVNTNCPKCNGQARRETNTMPQWAGSSWYYLRYIDPENKKSLVSLKKENRWMPVDVYVGGVEHATRHLIYARFWHKFLYDIKSVSTLEPFQKLKSQGMISGPDGRKMSKRFGNVINPDTVVSNYGADSLRLYEMFMGPFEQGGSWSDKNIMGVRRFLERVWKISDKISKSAVTEEADEVLLNKTIKQVTKSIEDFSFNTVISDLMILSNRFWDKESIKLKEYESLLILLAPFAPHITEELWQMIGKKKSIHVAKWPSFNPDKLKDKNVSIVIQVNGKVRAKIVVEQGSQKGEILEKVKNLPEILKWIPTENLIKKEIFIPDRLINFVI